MGRIEFSQMLQISRELLKGYDGSEQQLRRVQRRAYAWAAEYVREKPLFAYNSQTGMELDKRIFSKNSDLLLYEADKYFLEKLKRAFPDFDESGIKPPSAVRGQEVTQFTEFRGGMLDYLRSIFEKSPEKAQQLFDDAEILALNAVTWTYHFAQRRMPHTFFRKEAL